MNSEVPPKLQPRQLEQLHEETLWKPTIEVLNAFDVQRVCRLVENGAVCQRKRVP